MTKPGMKAANCEHEYERSGEADILSAAHDQSEAAGPMDPGYLRARDIEAIVMCGAYIDLAEQRTWPSIRSDRSSIVEKWAVIVKRLLDFGC